MKRFIFSFLLVCMCLCEIHAQYQVNYISSNSTTVTLRSIGYEKKLDRAKTVAELATIKKLLFQGIDNAIQPSPLIETSETVAVKKHSNYFKNLYNGRYKDFIQSSIIKQGLEKDATKKKCAIFDITINIKDLRRDLEQNGVIRKFGF